MNHEVNQALAELATAKVRVDVDGDVFVAELRNGKKYELMLAELLWLKGKGKLNEAGIMEAGTKI